MMTVEAPLNAKQAAMFKAMLAQIAALQTQVNVFAAVVFAGEGIDAAANVTLSEQDGVARLVGQAPDAA